MKYDAKTVEEYISLLPEERVAPFKQLRKTILDNLPEGFEEGMGYGMPAYYIPHNIYPDGYHCDPKLPLPFMNIASQKNFIGFYHMGIYSMPEILEWFTKEYPKYVSTKLDMGKSCVRLKKMDQIPYKLFGELVAKISPEDWIRTYENAFKKK